MTQNSKNIKAQVTSVQIGNLEIEGLMNNDGTFGVSLPQVCTLFQFLNHNASREVKSLLGKDFEFLKWRSALNPKPVNVLPLKDFELLLFELTLKQNPKAIKISRSLVGLSLQQLFCDAFCIKFEQSDRQEWLKQRLVVKRSFRISLTDALQRYGYVEPWQYGKFVHAMQEALGIKDDSRDELSVDELVVLESAQRYIGMAVDEFNLNPYDALKRYVAMM